MSSFASVGKFRAAGLIFLLLAFGMTPALLAQGKSVQKTVSVALDGFSYLGIQMEDVTADNMAKYKLSGERGVIIKSVEKGSPAEAAKLQENDVILEYAGMPVMSTMQLSRMVRETPVGRKVDIVVSRDGKKVNLAAEIGKREGPVSLDRGITMLPRQDEGRGFELFGPNGRIFQFRVPEGKGAFNYLLPRGFTLDKPRLGVTLEPLTDQMAEFLGVPGKKGALVTSVEQGSPAASKLKAGDVITRADNQSVDNPDDLARIVRNKGDGRIDLKVVRDKKEVSIAVDLPKNPDGHPKYPTCGRFKMLHLTAQISR
jgi:serine protease Do